MDKIHFILIWVSISFSLAISNLTKIDMDKLSMQHEQDLLACTMEIDKLGNEIEKTNMLAFELAEKNQKIIFDISEKTAEYIKKTSNSNHKYSKAVGDALLKHEENHR